MKTYVDKREIVGWGSSGMQRSQEGPRASRILALALDEHLSAVKFQDTAGSSQKMEALAKGQEGAQGRNVSP